MPRGSRPASAACSNPTTMRGSKPSWWPSWYDRATTSNASSRLSRNSIMRRSIHVSPNASVLGIMSTSRERPFERFVGQAGELRTPSCVAPPYGHGLHERKLRSGGPSLRSRFGRVERTGPPMTAVRVRGRTAETDGHVPGIEPTNNEADAPPPVQSTGGFCAGALNRVTGCATEFRTRNTGHRRAWPPVTGREPVLARR